MLLPPDPRSPEPLPGNKRVRYVSAIVSSPLVQAGRYSYYHDPAGPGRFEIENVLYHHGPERLLIGSFCSLATGVRFIMNAANHRMNGLTTFPFPIFGGAWAEADDLVKELPNRGDTVVGNDVWIGYEALINPGIRIGHGAIVAARSVVTKDVRPYAVVGGNPALEIRRRFSDAMIEKLLVLSWWDWPIDRITEHVRALMTGDESTLDALAADSA